MPNQNTVIDISFNLNRQQAYRDLDTILKSMQGRADKAAVQLGNVGRAAGAASTNIGGITSGINQANGVFGKLSQVLTHNIVKMGEWAIAGTGLYGTMRKFEEMGQIVYEVDDAMRQVRGVTGKSAEDTEYLTTQYQAMADELNTTTTSLANLSLELYRQGLTADETATRMESITKIAGVENLDPSQVLQYVTASTNAYKEMGLTAEQYGDMTVKAAAVSATSVQEIATGLQKSSAIASSAGVSFSKLESWIATLSETTRESASTIGNSVKGILARFSRVNEYGEDNTVEFGKVRAAVISTGVAFEDMHGQMRPVEDIMSDLAQVFPTLNKNQQNYLATQIGGAYHINKILTLFNNWNRSLEIHNQIVNSAGEVERQYGEKVNSVRGKVDELKNAFEDLALQTLNSDMLKAGANTLVTLVKLVDKIGIARIAVVALTIAMNNLLRTFLANTTIGAYISLLGSIKYASSAAAWATMALSDAMLVLKAAMSTLIPVLIVMAVYEIVTSYNKMQEAAREVTAAQQDFNKALGEFNNTADPSKIDEMTMAIEKMKQALKVEDTVEAVESLNEELSKLIERRKQLEESGRGSEAAMAELTSIGSQIEALKKQQEELKKVTDAENELAAAKREVDALNSQEVRSEMVAVAQKIADEKATIDLIRANRDAATTNRELMNQYPEFVKLIDEKTGMVGLDTQALETYLDSSVNVHNFELSSLKDRAHAESTFTTAKVEETKNRILAISNEIKALERLANANQLIAGGTMAGKEAAIKSMGGDMLTAGIMEDIAASDEMKGFIDTRTKELKSQMLEADVLRARWEQQNAMWEQLKDINVDDLMNIPTGRDSKVGGGGGGGKAAKETAQSVADIMDAYEKYKQAVEDLGYAIDILRQKESLAETEEEKIAFYEQIIAKLKEQQAALHEYNNALREGQALYQVGTEEWQKFEDAIRANSLEWYKLQNEIKDTTEEIEKFAEQAEEALKKLAEEAGDKLTKQLKNMFDELSKSIDEQKKQAESLWDTRIKAAEDELDAYKAKIQALEDQYEREKLVLEVQKAQKKLANVSKQKNVRLFTGKEFEWVADPKAVMDAEEALQDATNKLKDFDVEQARTAEEKKLQARIDALKEEKTAEMNSYEERKARLNAFEDEILAKIEENQALNIEDLAEFLSTTENSEYESFVKRLEQLQEFVTQWNKAISRMKSTSSSSGGSSSSSTNADGAHVVQSGGFTSKLSSKAAKAVGGDVDALDAYRVNELGTEGFTWKNNGKDYLMPLTDGSIVTANKMKDIFSGNGSESIILNGNVILPNVQNPMQFGRDFKRVARNKSK